MLSVTLGGRLNCRQATSLCEMQNASQCSLLGQTIELLYQKLHTTSIGLVHYKLRAALASCHAQGSRRAPAVPADSDDAVAHGSLRSSFDDELDCGTSLCSSFDDELDCGTATGAWSQGSRLLCAVPSVLAEDEEVAFEALVSFATLGLCIFGGFGSDGFPALFLLTLRDSRASFDAPVVHAASGFGILSLNESLDKKAWKIALPQ